MATLNEKLQALKNAQAEYQAELDEAVTVAEEQEAQVEALLASYVGEVPEPVASIIKKRKSK